MRIAVTGGTGQLVLSLAERVAPTGDSLIAVGRPVLDLSHDDDQAVFEALAAQMPDVIINAAAHTNVDKAETERDGVFAVNAYGAGAVARAARRLGVPIVQISTDYVFAGDKPDPYVEHDATGPTGVYGSSKLSGERAVLESGADAVVLRTSWVYSPFGHNFVKTMLRLAGSRDEISVVADQHGCPTSALDLADACIGVAKRLTVSADLGLRGVFHAAGGGESTWADFAEGVFAASAAAGGPSARVVRVSTAAYPTQAMRPRNSRLSCEKLASAHGIQIPPWQTSLDPVVARLVAEIKETRS